MKEIGIIDRILFLFFILAGSLLAEEQILECRVSYVARDQIYLDAGSLSGVSRGNEVYILQTGQSPILAKVVFVSEKSSACRLSSIAAISIPADGERPVKEFLPVKGDRAQIVLIPVIAAEIVGDTLSSVLSTMQSDPGITERTPEVSPDARTKRLSGRWSLGNSAEINADQREHNQPWARLALNWRIPDKFELRFQGRQRWMQRPEGTHPESRITEFSLLSKNKSDQLNWAIGRLGSRVGALGRLDGIWIFKGDKQMRWSMFLGYRPEELDRAPTLDRPVIGARFALADILSRWRLDFSGAGRYLKGQPEREWLRANGQYKTSNGIIWRGQVLADLFRADLKQQHGSSFEFSSVQLGFRWPLLQKLTYRMDFRANRNVENAMLKLSSDSLLQTRNAESLRSAFHMQFKNLSGNLWALARSNSTSGGQAILLGTAWEARKLPAAISISLNAQGSWREESEFWRFSLGLRHFLFQKVRIKLGAGTGINKVINSQRINWQELMLSCYPFAADLNAEIRSEQTYPGKTHLMYSLRFAQSFNYRSINR
jgi:hypothetical protein